jgi:hypothetical protein
MTHATPRYVAEGGVSGAPVAYTWTDKTGVRYLGKDLNVRLYRAVDALAYRAKMAVGVAIAEWIVCRFQGLAQLDEAWRRLEAARAVIVDSLYAKDLSFDPNDSLGASGELRINDALEVALTLLGDAAEHYCKCNIYLAEPVVNLAMLARHVLPAKKEFDAWLEEAVRRAGAAYAPQPPYDKWTKKYDASGEDPVPLELFDPAWTYTPTNAKNALRAFLATLDPKANPYLNTPDEMKAKGFSGTPYQL